MGMHIILRNKRKLRFKTWIRSLGLKMPWVELILNDASLVTFVKC